jgi:hypothetical protein
MAMAVARTLVTSADQKRAALGGIDQKGPRVRARKMVRCSATASFRNIKHRFFKGRGVIYAIPSHAHDVSFGLEEFDDVKLMLREDLGKAIGLFYQALGLPVRFIQKSGNRLDVEAQVYLLGYFPGNGGMVPGHHLHADSHGFCRSDGFCRILPRRVVQGDEAGELLVSLSIGSGYP